MSESMQFEFPFSRDVPALQERLAAVLREHADKVEMDWESLTGRFRYWKFGLFGAEGTIRVQPKPDGVGGRIAVTVTRHRGVSIAAIRSEVERLLQPT